MNQLKKGQQAMAFAMLHPEAKRGGARKRGASSKLAFSKVRLSNARAVLRHSRVLAENVIADRVPLDAAFARVKKEQDRGCIMMKIKIASLLVEARNGKVEVSACSDDRFESPVATAALSADDALYLAGVLVRASEMVDRRRGAG